MLTEIKIIYAEIINDQKNNGNQKIVETRMLRFWFPNSYNAACEFKLWTYEALTATITSTVSFIKQKMFRFVS